MPNTVHTFAGNPLDRGEVLRRDEANIEALAQDPTSLFLPFHRLNVATAEADALAWHSRTDIEQFDHSHMVFLGLLDGVARFAVTVESAADPDMFVDCRAMAAQLPVEETGMLAQARAQLDWHRRNKFCVECGQPMRAERGGQIRRCSGCTKHIFPRTDPVAIMLIVDKPGGDRCLLGQSQGFMARTNFYSALAGFLEQGESLEEAVRREVREESGVRVGHVQYHSSQPWPFPSQLMIGCHGIAETLEINIDEEEMADVRWFERTEIIEALNEQNGELRVPGALAIAHHLIRAWAFEEVTL